jgi:flagellar hook assembly protein FlgD
LTATPYGKNRVQASIYDANGATVATLLPGGSDLIIHDFTYSANPFTDNGINILNIYDSNGHSFAQWDGRNFGRTAVPSGIYMVHVVTIDPDGNSYVVDLPLDVIAVGSDGVAGFSIRDLGAEYVIQSQVTNVDWIKIRIYNLNGELIKGFEMAPSSGQFSASWNKRTTSGARAANGIYVVVIEFKDSGTGYLDRRIEKLFLK